MENEKNNTTEDTNDFESIQEVQDDTSYIAGKQPKPKRKKKKLKEGVSFLLELVICVVAAFVLSSYVIRPVQVKGNSMYPTLKDESIGFSNIIGKNIGTIDRFDIVIVYLEEKNEFLVKRVVGLPGETISYEDGQLYVNGEAVEETFLDTEYAATYGDNFMSDVAPITLGEEEYYCLGDNRPHSSDSRVYGPFHKSDILSKGVFVFFPFTEIGVKTW